jgi:hypothetical protein
LLGSPKKHNVGKTLPRRNSITVAPSATLAVRWRFTAERLVIAGHSHPRDGVASLA